MAGTVFLRTNLFEVKLEGITFKTKDFASLCRMDFLFPGRTFWAHPPVIGLDVMRHPRDPSILLLLLSFGIGCVILRFGSGEPLPLSIYKFLSDKRVHFVCYGMRHKEDRFPFQELGLTKDEIDIGYIAANVLKDPKYKACELGELAEKVLGVKKMIGLTEVSSFQRHEEIKCCICQLFITTVIAMGLLNRSSDSSNSNSKKTFFLKTLNSLNLLAEGWFKLPLASRNKSKKKDSWNDRDENITIQTSQLDDGDDDDYESLFKNNSKNDPFIDWFLKGTDAENDFQNPDDTKCDEDSSSSKKEEVESASKDDSCLPKKPIKGILKCPSKTLYRSLTFPSRPFTPMEGRCSFRRANSKGCNVHFEF